MNCMPLCIDCELDYRDSIDPLHNRKGSVRLKVASFGELSLIQMVLKMEGGMYVSEEELSLWASVTKELSDQEMEDEQCSIAR